jgi:AraC family transcriptional regulator, transcriptional activator of pobA
MDTARMLDNRVEGPPVYTYEAVPGVPPVSVLRFRGWEFPPGEPPPGHAHSHDFLVLCYFERGQVGRRTLRSGAQVQQAFRVGEG